MTYGTKSLNKNIPHIKPAFEREYFKQSHHGVADIIKVESFRISPEKHVQKKRCLLTFEMFIIEYN